MSIPSRPAMLLLVLALTVVFTAAVAYIDEHIGMPPAGKPDTGITCRYDVPAGTTLPQLHYYGSQESFTMRPGMQAVCMLAERTDVVLSDSSVVDGWRVTIGWHSVALVKDGETQALVPAWQDSSPVLANWLIVRLGDAGTQNMAGNCLLGMGEMARPYLRRAAADQRQVRGRENGANLPPLPTTIGGTARRLLEMLDARRTGDTVAGR